jgi:hypothetical protein
MDQDDAFDAFERSLRPRTVVEAEQERIAKGHPPDEALLKHGGEIEDELLRAMAHDAERLSRVRDPAAILPFPSMKKKDGA